MREPETAYGQESVEIQTGHYPVPEPGPADNYQEALERWSNDHTQRPENQEPDVIEYKKRDEQGDPTGETYDKDAYVSAERAAEDLAAYRRQKADAEKEAEQEAIRNAIDEIRREPFHTGQQPEQPQQQPVPEYQQPPPATNDEIRGQLAAAISQFDQNLAIEQNPQLREYYQTQRADLQAKLNEATWAKAFEQHPELVGMVEAEIANKVAAQTAQVQQYQQQLYAQEQQIAQIAVASLLSEPEFRGLNPQDIPAAMKIMQRDAPERAAQISARTQAAYQLVQQHQARAQETAKAQAEAQRANFLNWAHQEDLAFDKANPGVTQELRDEAMQMLRDTGLRDSDISQLYNSAPWFRSAATQAVLKDAAEARLARKSLREHRVAPPPCTMMKPGGAAEQDLRREYEGAPRLPSEFANAKEAAAFLTKVRAARR